jgi:hypothetical protein
MADLVARTPAVLVHGTGRAWRITP